MIKLVIILFSLLSCTPQFVKTKPWPQMPGIRQYVRENSDRVVAEYESKIDTLYDVYIYTENLTEENLEKNDLGAFYAPEDIVINDDEKYIALELSELPKDRKQYYTHEHKTVKGVIFHELTHAYFYQTITIMKFEDKFVSSEYNYLKLFPMLELRFGAEFIEEGVCEYVVYYLNENLPMEKPYVPKTIKELLDEDNYLRVKYDYSVVFIKDFLDEYGLKEGIEIIVANKPPSYEEMINPQLYFKRLNYGTIN